MSEATEMLGDGLGVLLGQHGVQFTVSQMPGVFYGIAESPIAGSTLTVGGVREDSTMTLVFSLDSGYVPTNGDVITAKGQDWAVVGVSSESGCYSVSLEGRSQ